MCAVVDDDEMVIVMLPGVSHSVCLLDSQSLTHSTPDRVCLCLSLSRRSGR